MKRLFLLMVAIGLLVACGGGATSINETFDDVGRWGVGRNERAGAEVAGGVLKMAVADETGVHWSTAGQRLGDGSYRLEATQTEGPLDNGYGLIFMADTEADDFYLFEVSGDGYVWIGRCAGACQENTELLVNEGWFESSAVNEGLNVTNVLRVEVEQGSMTFFVNGEQVGQAFDSRAEQGDVGVVVETLGVGGVVVEFDNFTYTPPLE